MTVSSLDHSPVAVFPSWLVAAQDVCRANYGSCTPETPLGFLYEVLTTSRGWTLIALGNLVGFAFSVIVLAMGVVSVHKLINWKVDTLTAIEPLRAAFCQEPRTRRHKLYKRIVVA